MGQRYSQPRPLTPEDQRDTFRCRSEAQTDWFRRHALQADNSDGTKVMVVTELGSPTIAAFYALSASHVQPEDAPPRLLKGVGRYAQPSLLLTRLGVSLDHEGRGLGQGMLRHALRRLLEVRELVGCRCLEVDAEDETAKAYYLHLIPQFEESPRNPLKLILFIKDIRRVLTEGRLD